MKYNLLQHYLIICIEDFMVKHGLVLGIEANLLQIAFFELILVK
jgi:hypothetical protein